MLACLSRFSAAEASLVVVEWTEEVPVMCSTTVCNPDSSHSQHTEFNIQMHNYTFTDTHTYTHNSSLAGSTDAKLYIMLCITSKEQGFPTQHIKMYRFNAENCCIKIRWQPVWIVDLFKCPMIHSLLTMWKSEQDAAAEVNMLTLSLFHSLLTLMCPGLWFVAH